MHESLTYLTTLGKLNLSPYHSWLGPLLTPRKFFFLRRWFFFPQHSSGYRNEYLNLILHLAVMGLTLISRVEKDLARQRRTLTTFKFYIGIISVILAKSTKRWREKDQVRGSSIQQFLRFEGQSWRLCG